MTLASQRACYFRLGEQTSAVGSAYLRQIVPVGGLTWVPRVGPELLGLFTVRGAVVPLIDLRPLMGLPGARGAGSLAALVEYEGRRLALSLDEVVGFFPLQEADAPTPPAVRALSRGAAAYKDVVATVIDIPKVMSVLEQRLVPA